MQQRVCDIDGLIGDVGGDVSHDQITRHLSAKPYTSKDLWVEIKQVVRQIERDDACLIFNDTVQEKAWTDENEIMCWHFDYCKGRSVTDINLLNARYHSGDNYIDNFRRLRGCEKGLSLLRHQNPPAQALDGVHQE